MVSFYDHLHVQRQTLMQCPEEGCNYTSNNKADLKDHFNARHIHFLCIKCEMCSEKFYTRRNYNRHRKTHHKAEILDASEENGKVRKIRSDDDELPCGSRLITPSPNESAIFLGTVGSPLIICCCSFFFF